MLVGYYRVSTAEQNAELQIDALQGAGCEKIYGESISSRKAARPELQRAIEQTRSGDTLVV